MLDSQQSDEQYMRQLYLRFLEDVKTNNNSEFYEKDELLDIYDYAQDEGDNMVQLYVFMAGARLYPDSDFLDERKAFFLMGTDVKAAKNMLDRQGRRESALWRVLQMNVNAETNANIDEELADLLSSRLPLSCEAVIRLLDTLHDLGRDDLIADSLPMMEERAENRPLLYYEVAQTLYHDEQYLELSRSLAEKLTHDDPFNADNWILLARVEFALMHADESIAAVDYALALDPENLHARLVKGLALAAGKKTVKESIAILKQVLQDQPNHPIAVRALAEAYSSNRQKKAAIELLYTYMQSDNTLSFVIVDALKLHPSAAKTEEFLELFDKQVGGEEQSWMEIAMQLAQDGYEDEAAMMLVYYHKHYKLKAGLEYMFHMLYKARLYVPYIQYFSEFCSTTDEDDDVPLSAQAYLMLAASYLMEGLYEETIAITSMVLNNPPKASSVEDSIRLRGLLLSMKFIYNLANKPELIPDDANFDPLTFQISASDDVAE
jgi:tetratricopeptide (TPR) repeat protein